MKGLDDGYQGRGQTEGNDLRVLNVAEATASHDLEGNRDVPYSRKSGHKLIAAGTSEIRREETLHHNQNNAVDRLGPSLSLAPGH